MKQFKKANTISKLKTDNREIDSQIRKLMKAKKRNSNKITKLREEILHSMDSNDVNLIRSGSCTISTRSSQILVIDSLEDIPDKYKSVREVVDVKRKLMESDFRKGEVIKGCSSKDVKYLVIIPKP